ncbi:hypothetical protein NSK_001315 [Nannochloropsis salina CCMP1776]|uniref:Suppressor of forked domain-containing protein n=1 Tax=Nannochloropsis salina CCMP1776 TaxID=1027361 RepID=A0A4D9D5I7_9STRA|nr:hypothetical protein NSK_001315 [Nannochloropsis salina CCMP1776]|eukprot:TFJ86981.1 hypothetical protein NSK_001315 [Nannochloropsis salina CCMP1776]
MANDRGVVSDEIRALLEDEQDAEFEEEIARNPFSLKSWLRYLNAKTQAKPVKRYLIYERALKFLPGSYKLWWAYLQERKEQVDGRVPVNHPRYQILLNTLERALVHLSRMPRVWLDYLDTLVDMKKATKTRRAFDAALQSLPITQHERIWSLYLPWAQNLGVKETAIRVFRRYLKYDPSQRESYVDFMEKLGEMEEAAVHLAICVNDDAFFSPKGSSKHALWMRLCDMCARHPTAISRRLKVDAIIRSGLARFTDETGKLWCKLADYYIRQGQFERARDVYEEALSTVLTVRDFTMVFDAYSQCEESLLTARVAMLAEEEEPEDETDDDLDVEGDDTDLRLARLEDLMERRPILLSSVLLRQNPHNVHEWHKRAKLFQAQNDPHKVIVCFTEAVKTVDPKKAFGKLYSLWTAFAKYYEEHDDIDNARVVLNKATLVNFKGVEELAGVYCTWAEMEIRHENFEEALQVMQHAVTEPSQAIQRRRQTEAQGRALGGGKKGGEERAEMIASIPVQERVHKSTRVWSLFLDLEESLGTVATTKAAYERCLELKVATPQIILNFASFLEENAYHEEAFRAYEKGVSVFGWPHVKPLWSLYLQKFVARYGGSKLERARDLFEQCLEKVPADEAADFYIRYAKLEEEHGLARHAMAIYDRGTQAVPEDKRYDFFLLYIKKVEALYGVTRTREVYQKAIEVLPDEGAKNMCIQFAELERKLGEIDRARAVYTHGANFADPRRDPGFWKKWQDFEVNYMADDAMAMVQAKEGGGEEKDEATADAETLAREVAKAEEKAKRAQAARVMAGGAGGVKRKGGSEREELEAVERQAKRLQAVTAAAVAALERNEEEIDIDDMEEEGEEGDRRQEGGEEKEIHIHIEGDTEMQVKAKPVPAAVFARAGLEENAKDGEEGNGGSMGALERLKKAGGQR